MQGGLDGHECGSGLLDSTHMAHTGGMLTGTLTGNPCSVDGVGVAGRTTSQWSVSKSNLSFPLEDPPGLGQVRQGLR